MHSHAELAAQPCQDGSRLDADELKRLLALLPGWQLLEVEGCARLQRSYAFANFHQALALANVLGELADRVDHHPALLVEWGRLGVTWWSHNLNGLQLKDCILAARCDRLAETAEGYRKG